MPEIYKFCHLDYSQHATIQFGDLSISSQSGSQQGYPIGGLLFCLAIHPTYYPCHPLSVWFMDDITIGGARSTVASDVDHFVLKGLKYILIHLNVAKCEVITKVHHQFDLEFQ